VLNLLGIANHLTVGAMLYRAGPDEIHDTVAFCGPGNQACWTTQGAAAHFWLTAGDDLIDFSVGDWRAQEAVISDRVIFDRWPDGSSPGPIQWDAPPPEFWWQAQATFTAPWRPDGSPPLGTAWYRKAELPGGKAALITEIGEMLRELGPYLRQRVGTEPSLSSADSDGLAD
jgi:hypothetical protein